MSRGQVNKPLHPDRRTELGAHLVQRATVQPLGATLTDLFFFVPSRYG